jgi:hypothetical protein
VSLVVADCHVLMVGFLSSWFQNFGDQFGERFDAVLDTIGLPETETAGINLLQREGHYMTLQVFPYLYSLCVQVLDSVVTSD